MRRENPLPFLFVLAFFFLVSQASRAQAHTGPLDSVPPRQVAEKELRRIDEHTKFGPHYKNRNAAGRVRTINRAVPPPAHHLRPAAPLRPRL